MGLWPPKVMKNDSCFLEAPSTPLSSRPERSAVEGPAVRRISLGNVFRQSAAQWRSECGESFLERFDNLFFNVISKVRTQCPAIAVGIILEA
jgi:hypothetical protein